MTGSCATPLSFVLSTALFLPFAIGQEQKRSAKPSTSFAVTMDEFSSLSEQRQIALLADFMIAWKEKVSNLSAKLRVDIENRKFDSKSQQPMDTVVMTTKPRHWEIKIIGNSYHITHQYASTRVSAAYYEGSGGRRMLSDSGADVAVSASLGLNHNQILSECGLLALIGTSSDLLPEEWSNPLLGVASRFLNNIENAHVHRVDRLTGTVEIRFPLKKFGRDGVCTETFLLRRMGLPVSEEFILSKEAGTKDYRWTTTLSEFELHDDLWFPSQVVFTAWSRRSPKTVTVHQLDISDVRLNALVPDDLVLDFPANTMVASYEENHSNRAIGFHVVTKEGNIGPLYSNASVATLHRDYQLGRYDKAQFEERLKALDAALVRRPEQGMQAPAIAAQLSNSRKLEPIEFNNQFTLIEFWSTTCAPCQKSMSMFNEFASEVSEKYPGKAQCVAICLSEDGDVVQRHVESRNWINVKSFVDRHVEDLDRLPSYPFKVAREYVIITIPTCIVVDDGGNIAYRGPSIKAAKSALLSHLQSN